MSDGFPDGRMVQPRRFPPLTTALIALNIVAFMVEWWLDKKTNFRVTRYGALSLTGLHLGYYWQFITFQFLHAGVLHLVLNCWGIYVFGPPIEAVLGKSRLALLYFLSGVAGGALQVGASVLSDKQFGGQVVGASAGVFGLVAAFTTLFPTAQMTLLLFFVIPLRMTANRMLTVAGVITAVGIMYPDLLLGKHVKVAHAAHLGGLVAGLILIRLFMRRFRS